MNENIDLTKILKDCPKGWKLYSPIFGEMEFSKIGNNEYSIIVTHGCRAASFTKEGFYYADVDGECLLFPSKDQRDWRKFTASWYKKERFDPNELKPFDKVLVRDKYYDCWICELYSHKRNKEDSIYRYITTSSSYIFCIPYNDDTKHLIGTTKDAPEYYRYWEN